MNNRPYGIILQCSSPKVHDKLSRIFLDLRESFLFPAGMDILMLPDSDSILEIKKDHHCLLFFEADPDNLERSSRHLHELQKNFTSEGHQTVLIVSRKYDYFELATRFEIGNIITEDQFDAPLLAAITRKLLNTQFFGFRPFFPNGFSRFQKNYRLSGDFPGTSAIGQYFSDFLETLEESERIQFLGYISELMINALSYGVYGITPEERDLLQAKLPTSMHIPKDKEIEIEIVRDEEKYGISISDKSGTLTLQRILEKLRRHTPVGEELLPQGLEDFAGRGLFLLSRENRLVINILQKKQTEIILMHFLNAETNHYQPLIINEKVPSVAELHNHAGSQDVYPSL